MTTLAPHTMIDVIRLGDREVGEGRRVLVVAEAGVNHDGQLDRALRLVDVAAEAGADMVKFQVFCADELASATADAAAYQQAAGATSQRDMLRRLELSDEAFAQVRAHCATRGVTFLATPFGPGDVERVLALGVPALKIASTDLNNAPLLQRAVGSGLPLIVSTGAAKADEIEACVARLRAWHAGERLILLHCVSGYPVPVEAANLRAIRRLREAFGVPCGFSDHTESTRIAGCAVVAGACVLEKHFTLDRAAEGPDHAMSLDPGQLAAYVAAAREAEAALGSGELGMSALEEDVRAVARKSLVAAVQIRRGATVTADMLTVKRPAGGIEPDHLDEVIGRVAATDIEVDTVVTWEHLQ
jgi:N-acetylneuraminate synthase/N,N'-diacetyllegionaminate synthase